MHRYSKAETKAFLETAFEFGERFPDVSDYAVWEHVEYVHHASFDDHSIIGRAIIMAYEGKMSDAIGFTDRMYH